MGKILVMGGTQFVSRSVAKYLIQKKHSVDIFTRGNIPLNYKGVNRHIKGDRKSKDFTEQALAGKKYDFVIDISAYTAEEIQILIQMLNKDNLKKYIFISSAAVYNKPEFSTFPLFKEQSPSKLIPHPAWETYGVEKKRAENYIKAQFKKAAINFVIIRPPYIYGMGNNLLREDFYFSRIESGQPILIPANAKTRIQFINIDDLCIFISECLTNSKAVNQIYNAAHPTILSWRDFADILIKVSGKKIKIYEVPKKIEPNARLYSPFRDADIALDTKKSAKHGLTSPKINLEIGLKRAYINFTKGRKRNLKDPKMTRLDQIDALMAKNES